MSGDAAASLTSVRERIDARAVSAATAVALALAYGMFVMWNGVPALRHDWQWPVAPEAMRRFLIDAWSGWDPRGIGSPAPYPSSYLLAVPLWLLLQILGSAPALFVFLTGVGLTVTFGVRALVWRLGVAGAGEIGLMAFALFNPWVYNKTVAGHVIMVMAYGATMLLAAALSERRIDWRRVAFVQLLLFGQIQFYLIGMAALLLRFRDSGARKAFAFGLLLFLPSLAGVLGGWSALSTMPYLLIWQQGQSIAPLDALLLSGYFAHYAQPIELLAKLSAAVGGVAAACACLAALRAGRVDRRIVITVAAIGLAAAAFATGTKGPLAPVYAFCVLHVAQSGLFRELYDLLGYLAVAYVVAIAAALQYRAVAAAAIAAGALAVSGWAVHSPAAYFVSRADLPVASVRAPADTRFALYPAFQPLSYRGRGSGIDPAAFERTGAVTPLNTNFFQYPGSAALMQYQTSGRHAMLSALSVSTVAVQPWLQSDFASLRDQVGSVQASQHLPAPGRITYLPMLSIVPGPQTGALSNALGAGNVFFGDLPGGAGFTPLRAPRIYADPAMGWVDAQFAFVSRPDLAQGLGGAATSSSRAVLRLQRTNALLVYAGGTLLVNGSAAARDTGGYRWIALRQRGRISVRCRGFCIVAGSAAAVPRYPMNPPAQSSRALAFKTIYPWLVTADPAQVSAGALRYNVAYSPWWFAFEGRRLLPHLRLDETVNGWRIRASSHREHIVIVQAVAALQTLLELTGSLAAFVVLPLVWLRMRGGEG